MSCRHPHCQQLASGAAHPAWERADRDTDPVGQRIVRVVTAFTVRGGAQLADVRAEDLADPLQFDL
jgi:hypothetical protein